MVTITNKATKRSYEVSNESAKKIKNSESSSKYIFGKIEDTKLPELEKFNTVEDKKPETENINTEKVENISENVEGIKPNEAETETVRKPKKSTAKVD